MCWKLSCPSEQSRRDEPRPVSPLSLASCPWLSLMAGMAAPCCPSWHVGMSLAWGRAACPSSSCWGHRALRLPGAVWGSHKLDLPVQGGS